MEKAIVFAIGSDHAGFELKEKLKGIIKSYGYDYQDFGTYSDQSVDYPDFAIPLCRAIVKDQLKYGILICGTGNGMAMAANKFRGIRAALSWKPEIAALARQHNDANVLCLGAENDQSQLKEIVKAFITCQFEGGRHQERVEMLKKMDNTRNLKARNC